MALGGRIHKHKRVDGFEGFLPLYNRETRRRSWNGCADEMRLTLCGLSTFLLLVTKSSREELPRQRDSQLYCDIATLSTSSTLSYLASLSSWMREF